MRNLIGTFVCLIVGVICTTALGIDHIQKANELHALKERFAIETAALEEQTKKVARYEHIISDMMQGQWKPEMGIQKEFVEDWYGTVIYSFKAVDRPPGSPIMEEMTHRIDGAIEWIQNNKDASNESTIHKPIN